MRHRLNNLILTLIISAFCLPVSGRQDSIRNRLVLSDGSVYNGQMRLRKPYGTGRTDHANGDVYEGAYEKGLRKGVGICHYANGDLYLGFWDNNLRAGEGELQYSSGDVYKGSWRSDERNGKGVYMWADGSYYSGEWKGDLRQGTGLMCWCDSSEYRGSWANGLREGQGEFKSKGYSLSEMEPYILIFFEPFYEALYGCEDKYHYTKKFHDSCTKFDYVVKIIIRNRNN